MMTKVVQLIQSIIIIDHHWDNEVALLATITMHKTEKRDNIFSVECSILSSLSFSCN